MQNVSCAWFELGTDQIPKKIVSSFVLLRVCRNTNKELREPSPFPTTLLTAVLSLGTVGTAAACGSDNTLKPVGHSVVHEDVDILTLIKTAVYKTAAVLQATVIDRFTPPHATRLETAAVLPATVTDRLTRRHARKEETMKQTTNLGQMHPKQPVNSVRDGTDWYIANARGVNDTVPWCRALMMAANNFQTEEESSAVIGVSAPRDRAWQLLPSTSGPQP